LAVKIQPPIAIGSARAEFQLEHLGATRVHLNDYAVVGDDLRIPPGQALNVTLNLPTARSNALPYIGGRGKI